MFLLTPKATFTLTKTNSKLSKTTLFLPYISVVEEYSKRATSVTVFNVQFRGPIAIHR